MLSLNKNFHLYILSLYYTMVMIQQINLPASRHLFSTHAVPSSILITAKADVVRVPKTLSAKMKRSVLFLPDLHLLKNFPARAASNIAFTPWLVSAPVIRSREVMTMNTSITAIYSDKPFYVLLLEANKFSCFTFEKSFSLFITHLTSI